MLLFKLKFDDKLGSVECVFMCGHLKLDYINKYVLEGRFNSWILSMI